VNGLTSAMENENLTTQDIAVDSPYPVRLALNAPPESLAVENVRLEFENRTATSQVTYRVRNASSMPITAYAIAWELVGGRGTRAIRFSAKFDSWGLGKPIQADEVREVPPSIGARGKRVQRIKAEIIFVEYDDGSRVGRAARIVGDNVDSGRQEMSEALRSFASTFRDSGLEGLKVRLAKETVRRGLPIQGCSRDQLVASARRLQSVLEGKSSDEVGRLLEQY